MVLEQNLVRIYVFYLVMNMNKVDLIFGTKIKMIPFNLFFCIQRLISKELTHFYNAVNAFISLANIVT